MKLQGLWNELPECCQQCQRIKSDDIGPDIFECSIFLVLPTRKKSCVRQIKKRANPKDVLMHFFDLHRLRMKFREHRRAYPSTHKKTSAYEVFSTAFDTQKIPDAPHAYWQTIDWMWREYLEKKYPELVRRAAK